MKFCSPNIEDIEIYDKFFREEGCFSYENTPTTLFIWDKMVNYKIYYEEDFLILGFYDNCFYLPFGNFEKGIKALIDYTKENNIIPYFIASSSTKLEKFKKYFNNNFTIREARDNFEYIYNSKDLAELSGKKYHSKRNHIKGFSKQYDYSYEDLSDENKDEIIKTAEIWYNENKTDETLIEFNGIKEILNNIKKLKILGGAIRVNNNIVGFTIASPINSKTINIHIEKALPEFKGAYPVINNEFAKRIYNNYKFINREDDIGIEGLRKAKLSYKPILLLKKYEINLNE